MANRLAEDASVGTVVWIQGKARRSDTPSAFAPWARDMGVGARFWRTKGVRLVTADCTLAANASYALDAGGVMSINAPVTAEVHAAESLRHAQLAGLSVDALTAIAVEFVLEGIVDRDTLGDALMDAVLERVLAERRDDPTLKQAAAEQRAQRGEG